MEILANKEIMTNIVITLMTIVGLGAIKVYAMHLIKKKSIDPMEEFMGRKTLNSLYIGIIIIVGLIVWNDSSQDILAFIGLFTAGMAIAMRDIWLNIIGGIYILWVSPFKVGDRIEIAGQKGDVINTRLLHFNMLEVGNRNTGEQSTGRILYIPNMQVFSAPLANYEKGFKFIWNEILIPIEHTSNWELAKEIIYELLEEQTQEIVEAAQEQIDEASKKYLIYYNNLTPIIYTSLKGNRIELTVRYLCEPRQVRMTENALWEALLKKLENHEEVRLA